ncbi:MAG: hypothetical protein Q9191_002351 [Dirinaria sp. TL-2023a]
MRPSDPRVRQTLNQISQNIESANLSTQASLFDFSRNYVSPCLSSFKVCLEASCQPCYACFGAREDQRRPHRNTRRARDDLGFDFYDDWDEEEGHWGNDELDRLLAGSDEQPGKRAKMSYGSGIIRRKSIGVPNDGRSDPNVVPKSSMFGFLESLPWKIGGRGVRYRPSAADLQENVGRGSRETQPLIEENEESGTDTKRGRHGRNRSGTATSRSTNNSLSSRGDLLPSEDEDDAVPLDDEFAMVLERRNTGATSDDRSSKKSKTKSSGRSRTSTKTASSKDTKSIRKRRRSMSTSSVNIPDVSESAETDGPTIIDLKREEEQLRVEEEAQVEAKRLAARMLASERGLDQAYEDVQSTPSFQSDVEQKPSKEMEVSAPSSELAKPAPNTRITEYERGDDKVEQITAEDSKDEFPP